MVGVVLGREPLGGTGDEIGHDRIDRDPAARNEDAGLPGRAEGAVDAAPVPFGFERERGVHLADRGIGAHREQALAGSADARSHLELLRRMAHVEEMPAVRLGRIAHRRQVAEPHMKPAGHVEARFERRHEGGDPALADHAARVGDTDDEALRALGRCFLHRHLGQVEAGVAPRQHELAEAPLRTEDEHATRSLGGEFVARVAEEKQIRRVDLRAGTHACSSPIPAASLANSDHRRKQRRPERGQTSGFSSVM